MITSNIRHATYLLFQVVKKLPVLIHLFYKSNVHLTFKMLTNLFRSVFSEVGSNNRRFEQAVYAAFTRYLREVASM